MNTDQLLANQHNLLSETRFRLKVLAHTAIRQAKNTFIATTKFRPGISLINAPVISFSESDLWNRDDNPENWILTAGKVENLRISAKKLNGLEVPAKAVFSFWKHIGYPGVSNGYVVGREIREGCIVPTVAGGLCQLSNALYDAALKAGFEIVERHKHTRVIKGSLAEHDRDATVKWNYVDLRFKASLPFRIEAELTADRLLVKFKSMADGPMADKPAAKTLLPASKLNDCYSCGNFNCFKHPDKPAFKQQRVVTTYLLDEKWPEYDEYIKATRRKDDFFIVPMRKSRFVKTNRYNWAGFNPAKTKALTFTAWQRALLLRFFARSGKNIFALSLRFDAQLAKAAAKHIPVESTHLVVSQNLLPFLWDIGAMGGRTFDVLMTRVPMEKLHERLNLAHKQHPGSKTLNDFRADKALITSESIALTKSAAIITPHQEIADLFNHKSIKTDWVVPKTPADHKPGKKILFPASAVARKGAYEMRQLALALNISLTVAGRALEYDNFFDGIETRLTGANPFDDIALVVYPAYVEHQPRLLLKAIAAGLPVVATTACGLLPGPNIIIVPIADFDALQTAVVQLLRKIEVAHKQPVN